MSVISQSTALEYINEYRAGINCEDLRSVKLGSEVIKAILDNASSQTTEQYDGIRVYLAKYTETVADTPAVKGNMTCIVALTISDVDSIYFDYGNPCPMDCTNSIGNLPPDCNS